ncbi:MAG: hypothetical protein ACE3L7_32550 [Candidatus Pristimantibacillus sp.]
MMTNSNETLTPEKRMNMVHENIAEMGMMIGALIEGNSIPQQEFDLDSVDIRQAVIVWAKEFEDKFDGGIDFDYPKGYPEIGNPETYIEAINNYTDLKLKEAGWLSEEYIAHEGRFWNDRCFAKIDNSNVVDTIKKIEAVDNMSDYPEVHIKIRLCKSMKRNKRVEVCINDETYYPCNPDQGFDMMINGVHCYSLPPEERAWLFTVPYNREMEALHVMAVIIDQDLDLAVQLNGKVFVFNAGGGFLGYSPSFEDQKIHIEIINELAGEKYSKYSFAK